MHGRGRGGALRGNDFLHEEQIRLGRFAMPLCFARFVRGFCEGVGSGIGQ